MKTLYVTSAETFSGKSALCVGLGMRFREDGFKAGYMKPVNVDCQVSGGVPYDEDVVFAKQVFAMPEPSELLAPIALTPAKLEQQLRGPETDFEPKLLDAFGKLSAGRDIMVLEGGRSLREGYIAGLPPKRVVELLDAKVLSVVKYDESLMVDRAMTSQNYFGPLLLGIVINEVPAGAAERVNSTILPFLNRHGMSILGAIPKDRMLSAPSVSELAEGLKAELLCCAKISNELVEHMLVGAMSVESALTYFRRKTNKAVITGGDRTDIQLAALETSTTCLILTGNIYPSPAVLNRAEELGVSVLLTSLDTLATVQITDGFFGRSRFQQPQKLSRFTELLTLHLNFPALYEGLGVKK